MPAQKRLHRLRRKIPRPPYSDMRMKRLEIRLESRVQHRILDALVQSKKVRVPFSHPGPNHGWMAPCIEHTQPAKRQKERRHFHRGKRLAQRALAGSTHLAEKAHGQVQLRRRQPAQSRQLRIEIDEGFSARFRQFEPDKKTFGFRHSGVEGYSLCGHLETAKCRDVHCTANARFRFELDASRRLFYLISSFGTPATKAALLRQLSWNSSHE
jgi:hypothetical protein